MIKTSETKRTGNETLAIRNPFRYRGGVVNSKMRGMRKMRKQRGGPHMRGILLLLLGGYLLDNYDY